MPKAYYDNTISGFLGTSDEMILGRLMISDEFRTTIEQKNSWRSEIEILKCQLRHVPDGSIIFSRFKYIKFSEKSIEFSIDEYMFINGRIDLVRDEVNHTITLVDFKSSSEVLSKEQIKNQLMVYVLGYESLTGEKVDYIESYDFNNSNPTTIELLENDREAFGKRLVECEKTIQANSYKRITEIEPQKDKTFCRQIVPIRTALVTARNAPAHERVIRTLRAWDARIDEAFFLGGIQKSEVLRAFGANIFFDDQTVHTDPASKLVPAARVPYKAK